jgi:hypothetical protein
VHRITARAFMVSPPLLSLALTTAIAKLSKFGTAVQIWGCLCPPPWRADIRMRTISIRSAEPQLCSSLLWQRPLLGTIPPGARAHPAPEFKLGPSLRFDLLCFLLHAAHTAHECAALHCSAAFSAKIHSKLSLLKNVCFSKRTRRELQTAGGDFCSRELSRIYANFCGWGFLFAAGTPPAVRVTIRPRGSKHPR